MSTARSPTLRNHTPTSPSASSDRSATRSSASFIASSKVDSTSDKLAIDLKKFRQHCEELKPFANAQKTALSDENYKKIEEIAKLVSSIHETPIYHEVVKIVGDVFGHITNPEPGSVGSLLRGCYTESNFPGRPGCSPTCAGSLPIPNIPGRDLCKNHVGIFRDGKFERSHRPPPSSDGDDTIYIHVMNEPFKMSQEDIDDLTACGIKYAIITPYNDGKFGSEAKPVKVADLPVTDSTKSTLSKSSDGKTPSKSSDGKTPSKSSDGKTPSKSSDGKTPSKSSDGKTPSKSSEGKTPSKSSDGKTPSKSSDGKTPSKSSDGKSCHTKSSDGKSCHTKSSDGKSCHTKSSDGCGWIIGIVVIIFIVIILCVACYWWSNRTTTTQYTTKSEYVVNNGVGWSTGGPGVIRY